MKTIQEELGGVSQEEEMDEMLQKSLTKNGMIKLKSILIKCVAVCRL
jgi:ATP-dependent Lon protease